MVRLNQNHRQGSNLSLSLTLRTKACSGIFTSSTFWSIFYNIYKSIQQTENQ